MKHSKRYSEIRKDIDRFAEYTLEDGIRLLKHSATAKFDESVEIAVNLGVNPKYADQMVRGTVSLPHGTGKVTRVLVLAKGPKAEEAQAAGADHVGFDDYILKLKDGWSDVDVIITTPDNMSEVGKLGRILGPRGLMPNPKSGTVTMDVASAVQASKAGRIEFRTDKFGIVHSSIGKISFAEDKLSDNINAFVHTLVSMRPPGAKGQYLKKVTVSSTMGPGIKIDKSTVKA
ncbi:MAG TPA: 50S ribosomal protein L1 [Candidatus Marinimicrobia bacterium]|nr:MAG: 50S ribosomal protein L1 [Candidatus Marinimicrobia bacterium CG1_02_48_14]PIZ64116.1 MAG: 50S ribosomal protein L1 [Candidatus Marinimicrobia bacterium CG_4_10_14_0_2_um_filter_48_9]PJA53733.1 MAG: 50S ribosomal protein L1 [Candidatus Marinimicrobia bacterium CG_4_9_14_3_um_filter_48_9]HCW76591.1 50S ribosomal protein L1 [Candidatus Neomarinimicrobiota bacterium]